MEAFSYLLFTLEMEVKSCERCMCICGYHVYKEAWMAAIREVFPCVRQTTNSDDRYAVAVKNDGKTVDQLLRNCLVCAHFFLTGGGHISLPFTDPRHTRKVYPMDVWIFHASLISKANRRK